MQRPKVPTRLLVPLALLALLPIRGSNFPLADLPGPPANPTPVSAGALIIPMDDVKQNLNGKPFNLAAYGLVNRLLQNKVPVYWVIRAGKTKDGVDFSARAERILPTAQGEALLDFSGGPFVVPPEFADQALTLAQAFGNQVAVYRLKEDQVLDVRYVLTFKPRILISDQNSTIHVQILTEANIPIPNYQVASSTPALAASSCYTIYTAPHTDLGKQATGVDLFVQSGGNFLAQCKALSTYETVYRFQFSGAVVINNVPNLLSYPNPDLAYSQFTSALEPAPGGSEQDWIGIPTGNTHPHALSTAIINNQLTTLYAATASKHYNGPGGMVFYLGGHNYGSGSTLAFYNGRRMYLNAIFVPTTRPLGCNLLFGALRGYVFLDLNANGQWDPGEPPIPGIQVSLTGPENLTLTTNAQGAYARGLDLGTYQVQVQVPSWAYVTTNNATQTLTLAPYSMTEASPVGLAYQTSPYAGQVVINEVLFRQRTGDVDEFIEIYNAGSTPVDLSGFRLMDGNLIMGVLDGIGSITGSNTPFAFPSGTVLGPGQYLVVWVGSSTPDRQAPSAQYQFYLNQNQARLADGGDDLWLYDPQLRIVDYVAWGSFPENYYPRNLWDATYQSNLSAASPGQSISLTPNGQDTNGSACWEPTTSNQAQARCPGWLPTVDTDDVPGRITSVGRNNNGFTLSGSVYHDLEPDGLKGPGEDWTTGTTVYVNLVQGNTVVQSVAVPQGTGTFSFQGVPPGTYSLVVATSNGATAPQAPPGWLFIQPGEGRREVVVAGHLQGLDFGLFRGGVVQGQVFWDDGLAGGTPNNALRDGGEGGVGGVTVTATDGTRTRTALTDGNGYYRLYIPYSWGNVALSHPLRPATGHNDGQGGVTLVGSWADALGPGSAGATVSLGPASGLAGSIRERNFGVVRDSRFYPDGSGQTSSPGVYTFSHWYRPGTRGSVTLDLLSPPNPRYAYQVRVDLDCDGAFGPGEDWASFPSTFTVGSAWPREADGSLRACALEVRALVPAGAPTGAMDIALLEARLTWAHNPSVQEPDTLTDTLQVTGGEVRLDKRVRNVSQNTPFGTTAQGKPNEVLEYCIAYRNLGTQPVSNFTLSDPVPFFTDALTTVADYGNKAIRWTHGTTTQYLTAQTGDDAGEMASGLVRVAVGTVGPGETGEVCYRVRIR
ncbi:SdrD B-like domain-containing protein [Thermus altitudinis]|uniref:SdrD B-like domain-containing protein n=1 Tax=Thermus altitudinis TaxID=2908145 RepID=UPI00242DFC76|nr:SdrD B-like domain-containing protein [Thermus altitudinis]